MHNTKTGRSAAAAIWVGLRNVIAGSIEHGSLQIKATNKAMSKTRTSPGRVILWVIVLAIAAVVAAIWFNRASVQGYAEVGTSYAARVGCSCRFVSDRSLEDCRKDKLAGMELVSLSDDAEARSVTARFPLVTSTTATYREGYGCVLEKWEG